MSQYVTEESLWKNMLLKVLRRYGEMNWLRSNNVKYFNDKTKSSHDLKDEILQLHKKQKKNVYFS